jgi:hypothetical protein
MDIIPVGVFWFKDEGQRGWTKGSLLICWMARLAFDFDDTVARRMKQTS